MLRALRTLVLTALFAVGFAALAPVSTLAATGDFCQAPGMVPGHINSSGQCVPDDIPAGQSCGSNSYYDSRHNCISCNAGFSYNASQDACASDSWGNFCTAAGTGTRGRVNMYGVCVAEPPSAGQECVLSGGAGYGHLDSSLKCVADASYGGQSCDTGYHADSSGNCVVDASYDGQSCAPGYTADASGNCVAGSASGSGASTPPPSSGGGAGSGGGGVQQSPLGGGRFTPTQSIQIDVAGLKRLSDSVIGVINGIVVPLLFAVAFLVFLYGVSKYFILEGDSDTKRETGRKFVQWAVIGFAVVLSVWGLVNLVLNTFSLSPGGAPPAFPTL